jgi:hypothetical protein
MKICPSCQKQCDDHAIHCTCGQVLGSQIETVPKPTALFKTTNEQLDRMDFENAATTISFAIKFVGWLSLVIGGGAIFAGLFAFGLASAPPDSWIMIPLGIGAITAGILDLGLAKALDLLLDISHSLRAKLDHDK